MTQPVIRAWIKIRASLGREVLILLVAEDGKPFEGAMVYTASPKIFPGVSGTARWTLEATLMPGEERKYGPIRVWVDDDGVEAHARKMRQHKVGLGRPAQVDEVWS